MRGMLLELAEHGFEAAFDAQYRPGDDGIDRQDFHRLVPYDVGSREPLIGVVRLRQKTRIPRERRSRKRNHIRIHSDLASRTQPAIRLTQRLPDIFQSGVRGAQDEIDERGHAARQGSGEHRLDMSMDLRLVELSEHILRKALNAEAQHAKPSPTHGRQPLSGHGIDTIRADELQMRWNPSALFRGNDSLAQRQDSVVAPEGENVVLKDDGAYARMRRDDALDHGQTFVRFEARNGCKPSLSLMQKIGGGTERASHRAIVERN